MIRLLALALLVFTNSAQARLNPLTEEFNRVATQVRIIMAARPAQFSEVPLESLQQAQQGIVLEWLATEHSDLECPDEASEQRKARRPFCLKKDGHTVVVSSTYFASTKEDSRERFAFVTGVLLRVAQIDGSANRAISLRVSDVSREIGYSADGTPPPPVLKPLEGRESTPVTLGLGAGVVSEKGAGTSAVAQASGQWQLTLLGVSPLGGGPLEIDSTVRGQVARASDGPMLYNIEASGQVSLFPILAGLWAAIKINQMESFFEGYAQVGLPVVSLRTQIGGEDYLLIRVNGGSIPCYFLSNGSKVSNPEFKDSSVGFSGLDVNASAMLQKGAFFLNFLADGSSLVHSDDSGTLPKGSRFHRFELSGSLGSKVHLLFKNAQVALEARHTIFAPDAPVQPDLRFNATFLGARYEVVWP